MNAEERIEKCLKAAPKPPIPGGLLSRLQRDVRLGEADARPTVLRRWFAPSGGSVSPRRVAAAAAMAMVVLLPLGYGAAKLIKRFAATSQLPAIKVDFPGSVKLSPDGKHFAGITWDSNLVVIDTSTGEQRNLAEGCYGSVVWSADGSEIAVMKRDANEKQAKFVAIALQTGQTRTFGAIYGDFEDWSPDGKHLLAVRNRAKAPAYRIVMINLESNERTVLASKTGVWPFPGFSPNGKWVSYVTEQNSRSILHLQEVGGPSHVEYSDFPGDIGRPLWSPDSSHIIFTGTQRGINRRYRDLWALRFKGNQFVGSPFPVVPDVEQMRFYNWAQNGQLAYRTGFELGGIFTLPVNPQTGKANAAPRQLVRRGGLGSHCWSPDGKQLAVREAGGGEFHIRRQRRENTEYIPAWD